MRRQRHWVLPGSLVVAAAWGCSGAGSGGNANGGASSVAAPIASGTASPIGSGAAPIVSGTAPVTSGTAPVASGSTSPTTSTTRPAPPPPPAVSRFLYVSNAYGFNLTQFGIDPKTGVLKKLYNFACLGGDPYGLATDPAQKFLFAVVTGTGAGPSNTVLTYAIDPTNGFLTLMTGSQPALGSNPQRLACAPSGSFLLVTDDMDDTVTSLALDAKGTLKVASTFHLALGTTPAGLAVSPDSKFVYVTGSGLGDVVVLSLDAKTGALAAVGKPIMKDLKNAGPAGMDPKGRFLYVATVDPFAPAGTPPGTVVAFKRDATTGALTEIGRQVTYNKALAQAVVVDPSGENCYAACDSTDYIYAYRIDATTGALTPNAPTAAKTGTTPSQVAIDATGKFAYAPCGGSDDVQMLTIDPVTGALRDNGSRVPDGMGSMPVDCLTVK